MKNFDDYDDDLLVLLREIMQIQSKHFTVQKVMYPHWYIWVVR